MYEEKNNGEPEKQIAERPVFFVPKPGASVSAEDVAAQIAAEYLRQKLAAQKAP